MPLEPLWPEPLESIEPLEPDMPLWLEPLEPELCFLLRFLSCLCELPVALADELPLL